MPWVADAPTGHKLSYWNRPHSGATIHRRPVLELYPFRFRDPLTGKWVRARYVAEFHDIRQRYAEWEITGEPEIRHVPDDPLALSAAHVARNSTRHRPRAYVLTRTSPCLRQQIRVSTVRNLRIRV